MTGSAIRIATGLGLAAWLALWLTACGSSPPSSFYRLTPQASSVEGGQTPSLGIGPIAIPEFLDRNALVYSADGNQLQISGRERWAEPLDDGVQRVVGLNLARLLQTQNLSFFPWDRRSAPDFGIRISVLDLDATAGEATLLADWEVYRPGDGATITRRISHYQQPLGGELSPPHLPPAYSALLYQLSETIAAAIREAEQDTATAGREPSGS